MYLSFKSRVKHCNKLGNEFYCSEKGNRNFCLPCFSYSLTVIEEHFIHSGSEGLDIDMIKISILLYADNIVIVAKTAEELQHSLDSLGNYWRKRKAKVVV